MKRNVVLKTAILLSFTVFLGLSLYVASMPAKPSQISEEEAVEIARKHANPPPNAGFEGVHLTEFMGRERYAVSWDVDGTQILVHVDKTGKIVLYADFTIGKVETHGEPIPRDVALKIAEDFLKSKGYKPEDLKLASVDLSNATGCWTIGWMGKVGDSIVDNAFFGVSVDAYTGEIRGWHDTLDQIPPITPPEVKISKEQAIDIVMKGFETEEFEYVNIVVAELRITDLPPPKEDIRNIPVWWIRVVSKRVDNPLQCGSDYYISPETGEIILIFPLP